MDAHEPVADANTRPSALLVAWEVTWIALRLLAVFYVGHQGALFFYQGF